MPVQGGTLVQRLPHMSHASTGLRHLYEKVESGTLPTVPTKDALSRTTRDKTVRYPHVKRVGPYLLGRNIGEGSFAKVKEALHGVVGEKVAIKIIDKKEARKDPYLRKNMRREASLLQSLSQHPNIISLYEVMETDNNFYMVLDLCTGGALLDLICSKKCLKEDEARRYVKQIVSAVDHIHQAGILHRDLKVENLLLDENNNIKIIDFGLSNFIGYSGSSKGTGVRAEFRATQCGSPAYAAPEIIANKRYGPKVDVWSIGVNTFAMLAGSLPFTVEPFNIKLLLKKINNREMAEIPSNLTNDCKDFIRRLLHPDPRKRYSILEAMNHKWLVGDNMDAVVRPRTASSTPNGRLSRMELETDILDYIWTNMGYNISHVTDSVISKRCDEYSAIYYLLLRRRDRHHIKMLRRFESTKDESGSDAKDSVISAPKLYDEATAMELAGRKHGSLHFKMALLLQKEKEEDATNDNGGDVGEPELERFNPNDQETQVEPIKNEKHVMTSSSNRNDTVALVETIPAMDHQNDSKSTLPNSDQNIFSFNLDFEGRKTITSKGMATEEVRREWSQASNRITQSTSENRSSTKTQMYKLSTAHRVNLTFRQTEMRTQAFSDHFNYRQRDMRHSTSLAPTRTANLSVDMKTSPRPTNTSVDVKASPRPTNTSVDMKASPRPTNISVGMKAIARPTNISVDMEALPKPANTYVDMKASPRLTNISVDMEALARPTNISVDMKSLPRPTNTYVDMKVSPRLNNTYVDMKELPRPTNTYVDRKALPRPTNISVHMKASPRPIWRQSDSIDTNNLANRIDSLEITPRDGMIEIGRDTNNNNLKDETQPFNTQSTNPSQNEAIVKYKKTRHTQHVPIEFANKRRKLKIVKRKSFENPSFILRRPFRIIKKSGSNDTKMIVRVTGRPKTPNATETHVGIKQKVSTLAANHQKRKQSHDPSPQLKKPASKKDWPASDRCRSPYKCEMEKSVKEDTQQDALSSQDVPEASPPLTSLSTRRSPPPNMNGTVRKPVITQASAESVV